MLYSSFSTKTNQELEDILQTSIKYGLSYEEVQKRFSTYGPNKEITATLSWYMLFIRQLKSPFMYLMLGATFLAFIIGSYNQALCIMLLIILNTTLTFIQEYRAQKALVQLANAITLHTTVIRAGVQTTCPVQEIVPGDIIALHPGDTVPADIRCISVENMQVNESTLTGESQESIKQASPLTNPATSILQAKNCLFAGTTIQTGSGYGIVFATGATTYKGTITTFTAALHDNSFARTIGNLSTFLIKINTITVALVFITQLIFKSSSLSLIDSALFALALLLALTPEALPTVTTLALAKAALKLSTHKVLIKRLSSLEDLASIDVLCTDKTGTLTENTVRYTQSFSTQSTSVIELWSYCLQKEPYNDSPFDKAIRTVLSPDNSFKNFARTEIPFDPIRKRSAQLIATDKDLLLIVRGAPETVTPLCSTPLTQNESLWIETEQKYGNRVLAIAYKKMNSFTLSPQDESDLIYAGAIAFEDPLKATTLHAIKAAQNLALSLKILTGDSPEVAQAIGYKLSLITSPQEVITGDQFMKLTEQQKKECVITTTIFARVDPLQKHTIIKLLQENHTVGFLGEGSNDAPALKSADVGIVVDNATDTAKENADIILQEKSLFIIVNGIKEARTAFANVTKYLTIILSSNFGNFYTIACASLFLNFLPLLPSQILLANLLCDIPQISLATDTISKEYLKQPASYNFYKIFMHIVILGGISSIFDSIFFLLFSHHTPSSIQTYWFIENVITQICFIFSLRTAHAFYQKPHPSKTLILSSCISIFLACILPFTNTGRLFFDLVIPTSKNLAIIIVLSSLYLWTNEYIKSHITNKL